MEKKMDKVTLKKSSLKPFEISDYLMKYEPLMPKVPNYFVDHDAPEKINKESVHVTAPRIPVK